MKLLKRKISDFFIKLGMVNFCLIMGGLALAIIVHSYFHESLWYFLIIYSALAFAFVRIWMNRKHK